jgi:hypothetical protein
MKLYIIIFLIIIFILFFLFFVKYINKQKLHHINININKPKLYCFWTGNNPLTKNRKRNLITLNNTGFDVTLITPNNLNNYILNDYPLHKGYQYLSETHKSDYLRCYFMNFYGGGYSDIKQIDTSWLNYYKELIYSDKWACGYAEISPGDIAYGNDTSLNDQMKKNYNKLIGNGCYIFKKNTPLTNEWYEQMIKMMDEKYDKLKKYPSKTPRQAYSDEYPYPFEWTELLGRIFHPLIYKYNDKIFKNLPYVNINNYR